MDPDSSSRGRSRCWLKGAASSRPPVSLWLAGFYTFVGAVCFLVGSYLLIPELFDGEAA